MGANLRFLFFRTLKIYSPSMGRARPHTLELASKQNNKLAPVEDILRPNLRTEVLSRGSEAAPDELGNDSGQLGADSAGQSGDSQRLSGLEDANDQSVEELADTDQAFEASAVEGVEDAADHPERPVHTHLEYGRPDDLAPETGPE
jgi:hypothetical protein